MADLIEAAGDKARLLYAGVVTPHRSCGICLAETFNLPTRPFQALRRGGLTGEGQCGAIIAGQLILGIMLGDPNPTGSVTPRLRQGMLYYQRSWRTRLGMQATDSIVCNDLTRPLGDFFGMERTSACTRIAGAVAESVQEALEATGSGVHITPIELTR